MKPMSLMFRQGSRFVEPFNQIIAERISFIDKELEDHTYVLSKKCSDHLYPDAADVSARYTPIGINMMSPIGSDVHY
ncbi:unnamed protein product [Sphagnum balticum]